MLGASPLHWRHILLVQIRLQVLSLSASSHFSGSTKWRRCPRSYNGDAEDNVKKMNLYFTKEFRDTLNSFTFFVTVKAITKLYPGHRNKFEMEFQKSSCCCLRSSDNAEFGHIMLFCRGQQRNVPRFITHAHSYCPGPGCSKAG